MARRYRMQMVCFPESGSLFSVCSRSRRFAHCLRDKNNEGKKEHIVTTPLEFYKDIAISMPIAVLRSKSHYLCRLYYDIEFMRDLNPDANGDAMVSLLLDETFAALQRGCVFAFFSAFTNTFLFFNATHCLLVYGLTVTRAAVIDLESSTSVKFSRHLIVHLPGAAFLNNFHGTSSFVELRLGGSIHTCCSGLLCASARCGPGAAGAQWRRCGGAVAVCARRAWH